MPDVFKIGRLILTHRDNYLYAYPFETNKYAKKHEINGSSAQSVTDYNIKIVVHYGSGTDSNEHVYLSQKCRSDFGDIRFHYGANLQLLDYWMEYKEDNNYAIFWIKVPYIPASPNKASIYITYGNPKFNYIGDGKKTFIDFDDFLVNTLYSYTQIDYAFTIDITPPGYLKTIPEGPTGFIYKSQTLSRAYAIMSKFYFLDSDVGVGFIWDGAGGGEESVIGYIANYHELEPWSYLRRHDAGTFYDLAQLPTVTSGWYKTEVQIYGNSIKVLLNDTPVAEATDTTYSTLYGVGLRQKSSNTYVADWWALRKYVYPEPSHGQWYPEEELTIRYLYVLEEI